jgi:hypothetical protein
MARSPIGDSEADRPIQSQERDRNGVSTVACQEVLHRSGSSKPAVNDKSRWFRAVVCVAVLVNRPW